MAAQVISFSSKFSYSLFFVKMLPQWFRYILLLFIVFGSLLKKVSYAWNIAGIVYTRRSALEVGEKPNIPVEVRRRWRGCKVCVKWRMKRRRFKPCIPAVITGNVRSLANKMVEFEALVRTRREYRECRNMCFMETWLHELIPDSVTISGFHMVRADRDLIASSRRKGGGLGLFVNSGWCNSGYISIKERVCNQNIKIVAVGLRPYYLLREFTSVVAIIVYILPSENAEASCDAIDSVTTNIQTKYPGAFILITGDFNHVSLSPHSLLSTSLLTVKQEKIRLLFCCMQILKMLASLLLSLHLEDQIII